MAYLGTINRHNGSSWWFIFSSHWHSKVKYCSMSMLFPPTTTQISIPFAFPVHKILNGHDLILYTVLPLPGPLSMGYSYYDWPSLDFKSASPEAISYPLPMAAMFHLHSPWSYPSNRNTSTASFCQLPKAPCVSLMNTALIETTLMCLYTLTIKSRPKLGG